MEKLLMSSAMTGKTEPEKEEKTRVWPFFAAFGILFILMISIYAFQSYRSQNIVMENRVNGFDFWESGEFWVTRIQVGTQPYDIPFYNHPRELTDIIVHEGVTDPLLKQTPQLVIISVDPDAGSQVVIAGVEIARLTGSRYDLLNLPTRSALSRAQEGIDTQVITCDDATNDTVVLQFVNDPDANAIVKDGNCIILFYKTQEDSVRVADRYAYALLGIQQ